MDGQLESFYLLLNFKSISIISGQWEGDNVRLCAVEPQLQLERTPPSAGLKSRTAISAGQRLSY